MMHVTTKNSWILVLTALATRKVQISTKIVHCTGVTHNVQTGTGALPHHGLDIGELENG